MRRPANSRPWLPELLPRGYAEFYVDGYLTGYRSDRKSYRKSYRKKHRTSYLNMVETAPSKLRASALLKFSNLNTALSYLQNSLGLLKLLGLLSPLPAPLQHCTSLSVSDGLLTLISSLKAAFF